MAKGWKQCRWMLVSVWAEQSLKVPAPSMTEP